MQKFALGQVTLRNPTTWGIEWPFQDPPNVAVCTSKDIVDDGKWIYFVSRDEEDGAWQFHSIDGAAAKGGAELVVLERFKGMSQIDAREPDNQELPARTGAAGGPEPGVVRWALDVPESRDPSRSRRVRRRAR